MRIARRDLIKVGMAVPLVTGLAIATPAFADTNVDSSDDHGPSLLMLSNETLSGSLSSGGTTYSDSAGNTYVEGAVYTGSASGTISGNFRVDLNIYTLAGSSSSKFWGSIVISNGATPSSVLFGEIYGVQIPASSGFTDQGRFELGHGLGTYLNNHSEGTLTGTGSAALNTSGSTISWTLNSVPGPKPHPGLALGLRRKMDREH